MRERRNILKFLNDKDITKNIINTVTSEEFLDDAYNNGLRRAIKETNLPKINSHRIDQKNGHLIIF